MIAKSLDVKANFMLSAKKILNLNKDKVNNLFCKIRFLIPFIRAIQLI